MDLVLDATDQYFFTPYIYPTDWPKHSLSRQMISLLIVVTIGGYVMYLATAGIGYCFLFDRRLMKHPQFLKNQVWLEIMYTCKSVPVMAIMTCFIFIFEVRGYSKLYLDLSNARFGYLTIVGDVVGFLFFTDMCIYWIHRLLHHRLVYKHIHKDHHKWKIPTPFASHAFHPVDGFLQSVPYHIYPFLFPLHKYVYLFLFVFVNIWTVSIHDGNYKVPRLLEPFVNGSAHHTDHHTLYNYNYGQFFTLWDRICQSFHSPDSFKGKGPIADILKEEARHTNNKKLSNGKSFKEE